MIDYLHTCTKDNLEEDPVWRDSNEVEYHCFCEVETGHLINILSFLKAQNLYNTKPLKSRIEDDLKKRRNS